MLVCDRTEYDVMIILS